MIIVVASHNPVKIAAVKSAFGQQFPGQDLDVRTFAAESGVDDQPFCDEETRSGAINRAHDAAEHHPDADFCVGIEGGVDVFGNQLMAFAWMAIVGSDGRTGTARSVTLPLPPAVRTLVDSGHELGEANDIVFSTVDSKHGGGAFGLLTGNRFTREGVYTETLVIALVPFVNEIYK